MKERLHLVTPDGHDDDILSERQQEYVIAIASTSTLTAAAEVAGCDRRTLARQLDRTAVRRAVAAARRAQLDAATERLVGLADTAITTLESILLDEEAPAAARVAAVKEVLARATSARDSQETEARIERLERAARNRGVR